MKNDSSCKFMYCNAVLLNSLDRELQNVTLHFALEKGPANATLPYGVSIHPKPEQVLPYFRSLDILSLVLHLPNKLQFTFETHKY